MSYVLNIIIILLLSLLTLGLLPTVSIANTVPLLPLFFIIALAYFRKGFEPIILAAMAGIFFDFYSAYQFGFYAIFFILVAVIIRVIFHEGMNSISLLRFLTLSGLSITFYFIIQLALIGLSDASILSFEMIKSFGYLVVVNITWAFIMYFAVNWYFDKLKDLENFQKRR
jgi:rod shape-determining protein MreD